MLTFLDEYVAVVHLFVVASQTLLPQLADVGWQSFEESFESEVLLLLGGFIVHCNKAKIRLL
mgnify:FL=1|jgi:hypothetical protein